LIYEIQYPSILEIAGLFQDYVIRIYNNWIEIKGREENILNLNLPRTLIKYILSLGTINSVKVRDNHIYVYMTGKEGNNFTIHIEHL